MFSGNFISNVIQKVAVIQVLYWGFHEKGTPSYLGALGWIDCRH